LFNLESENLRKKIGKAIIYLKTGYWEGEKRRMGEGENLKI